VSLLALVLTGLCVLGNTSNQHSLNTVDGLIIPFIRYMNFAHLQRKLWNLSVAVIHVITEPIIQFKICATNWCKWGSISMNLLRRNWSIRATYIFNPFRSYIGPRPTVWFSSSAPMSEDVRHGFCCVCSPAVGACPTLFLV